MLFDKFDISLFEKKEYEKWYSLMSVERRRRTDAYRAESDRLRSVAGDMLIRKNISKLCGTAPENVSIEINPGGKPYAVDIDIEFNISHSGDFAVLAMGKNQVGIDVEIMRSVNLKLAKRVFDNVELEYLFGCKSEDIDFNREPDSKMRLRFYELWTAKEAYSKYTGTGLVSFSAQEIHQCKSAVICSAAGDEYYVSVYCGDKSEYDTFEIV